MNHLRASSANWPTRPPTPARRDHGPAQAAFTVGPRRRSIAVDWIGIAVGPRADAVADAGPGAGLAVEGYLHATTGRRRSSTSSTWSPSTSRSSRAPPGPPTPRGHTMTIDALLRLVELLNDTADYAAGVNQPAIAAELAAGRRRRPRPPRRRAGRRPQGAPGPARPGGRMTSRRPRRRGPPRPLLVGCSPGQGPSSPAAPATPAPRPHRPLPHWARPPRPPQSWRWRPPPRRAVAGRRPVRIPPAANTSSTTTVASAPGRTDPTVVAGLRHRSPHRRLDPPAPGRPEVGGGAVGDNHGDGEAGRGQHYQPARRIREVATARSTPSSVSSSRTPTPIPGANAYLATIDIRTSSSHGTTTSQASLLLTVIRRAGGWLVDDTQVVG